MRRAKGIDGRVAELEGTLEALDREISDAARIAAEAARLIAVPDAWQGGAAPGGSDAGPEVWDRTRLAFAGLVSAVADCVEKAMAPLQDKPRPTPRERIRLALADFLSKSWTRQRKPQAVSLDQALVLANRLHGLLAERRKRMAALRHTMESDLVTLTGHRSLLVDNLVSAAGDGSQVTGASLQVEQYLQAVQDMTASLNRQLSDMNVLFNKLTIESESAIVLAAVLAEEGTEAKTERSLDRALLPHLAPLFDLKDRDLLSSIEIARRKEKIDARFQATFARAGGVSDTDSRTAGTQQEATHA